MSLQKIKFDHTIITANQAIVLEELGVIQTSRWAWQRENGIMVRTYDNSNPNEPMAMADWTEDADTWAAYDSTDLDYMLYTLGSYITGPTFFVDPSKKEMDFGWWCDHVQRVTDDLKESTKATYGAWPAMAKGNMLIQLIRNAEVPMEWEFYRKDRMSRIMKGYPST